MMRVKSFLAAAVACTLLSGCLMREANYSNYGKRPHEWELPGPDFEKKVFGPMPYEEVKDFVREKESGGWEIVGYEPASLPEDVMIDTTELDQPSRTKKPAWRFDIPKTMDARTDAPKKATVPPYLDEDVKAHRQKYIVIMRRWL
jgi:hypothetical protein